MTRLTFHLILHTHWDREWYLPRAAFQARLVPTVGAVIDLLDREPDARFLLDGQTIAAEDVLDVRPEWIDRLGSLVAERRLEVGPWYVLGDELVPAGESLIRNLLQGTRDATVLGARMDVLYSPDAFGHPAILPSLAAEFGIDAGVVWRGLGHPTGVDRDLYRWRGADGAEMLTYHLPGQGYEIGYDLIADPEGRWSALRDQLVARATTSHIAVFVGADHHAPPADPVALRDAISALESGNFVRLSTLGDFFDAAKSEAGSAPPLDGELRWSYGHTWTLQGTHATRARLKRRHGAAELYLTRVVEPMAALAAWHRGTDDSGLLRATWRALLQCQFHDTICGCCSDDVAQEQGTRLTSVGAMSREIARSALHGLSRHDPDEARRSPTESQPALVVWNPVPRTRTGIVTAEVTCFRRDVLVGPPSSRPAEVGAGFRPFGLVAGDGTRIPVQVLSVTKSQERSDATRHYPDQDEIDLVRVAFELPATRGLGFTSLSISDRATLPVTDLSASATRLANRFVSISIEHDRIDVVDQRRGERYSNVLELVDEGDDGDTYTPWVRGKRGAGVVCHGESRLIANGPFVAALERQFLIDCGRRGQVAGRMVLLLHADSPVLRVRMELDNRAVDHRLRLRIPVGVGKVATVGAPFGFERRDVVQCAPGEFPTEEPVCTAPAQRYVAAGVGDRGVALLSPGHFEYEWNAGGDIILTLLRSTGELSKGDLPTRPGHAGWPMSTPDAQELGRHVVEFAIAPLVGGESSDVATLERLWQETFLAPQSTFVRKFAGQSEALDAIGAELSGQGLVFTAMKRADSGDGIVLRCYNVESSPVEGQWIFRSPIGSAMLVRADESVVAALAVDDEKMVRFTASARGIVSILLAVHQ